MAGSRSAAPSSTSSPPVAASTSRAAACSIGDDSGNRYPTRRPDRGNAMIEVRGTTVYRGPNIWARMPVILTVVDIDDLEDRPTNKIPGFYEQLTELIPSLYDHGCSLGRPGGFLQRMRE